MASAVKKLFNFVFWLLVLVIVSFVVAVVCFPFYTFFGILAACCSGLQGVSDTFLRGVMFPSLCAKNMVQRNSYDAV